MKKDYIVIPTSKVLGVITILEGVCASILIDQAVKGCKCNRFIKSVGRTSLSSIVSAPFIAAGCEMISNDEFDIKIKLKKDDNSLKKTHKNFNKAFKLWEKIFNTSIEMDRWYDKGNADLPSFNIRFKDIIEFDKLMINITEKLGIDYTPILINIPCNDHFGIISQPDMMNIILAASESVTDTIFKCHLRLNTDHIDTNEAN